MTHDELLKSLEPGSTTKTIKVITALRAVVELHKPNGDECLVCESHYDGVSGEWGWEIYPCPTIQAIEKELM